MVSLAAAVLAVALQAPVTPMGRHSVAPWQQLAESWDDLSPTQRDRALKNYRDYMQLPQEKRHDIDRRYEKWKQLPQGDRERFRQKHDRYHGMGLVDD